MEAIRTIQTVENGEVCLQLPKHFWGQEVEIIVMGTPQEDQRRVSIRKSLRGCLKHYAKPELMTQEQDAWQTAASEKHEPGI
jgi:hypothetical protein